MIFRKIFFVWITNGLFLLWLGGSVSLATTPDPFDLASINLHPVYLSPSNMRPAATLHAVATSRDPSAPVSIAVGDGGAILRSTDDGQTWDPIDRMMPLAESPAERAAPLRFGAKRPVRRFTAIPMWHFYDVAWLSSVDAIVVGGAFEPVTGISRGVCLISDDAGETWSMGNAHELPRLKRIIRRPGQPVGTVEVIGDASEASGIDRFLSYDAGRTWGEANKSDSGTIELDDAATDERIRVGEYGQIALRRDGEKRVGKKSDGQERIEEELVGQWQIVRGGGRHAAVAIVAASPHSIVWSLAGRESLHENRRVVMALADPSSGERSAERSADAAKLLGVTVCDRLPSVDPAELQRWLSRHRPAVVVLDDALDDEHYRCWIEAIEHARQASSTGQVYPQRVLISRTTGVASTPSRDPSIWKRSSVLRADALLTGPAALAGDFAADAWMIAAPGCPTPSSVEIATLNDLTGAIRRDIALAAGLALEEGQTRVGDEVYVAANRRLQIATARISQTANLQNQLSAVIEQGSSDEQSAVTNLVQNALAVTAPEDRTRLLWAQLTHARRIPSVNDTAERPGFAVVRRVLLKQLAAHATPASIRRWADWTSEMFAEPLQPIAADEIPELARVPNASPGNETANHGTPSRMLSPFQVAPVGYHSPSNSDSLNSIAPTAILIPQTKPTVWQSSRGIHGSLSSPKSAPHTADPTASEVVQRVNWDFHPVVMASRNLDLAEQSTQTPRVPITGERPILDGNFGDACWRDGRTTRDHLHVTKIVRDAEYWYFAITCPSTAGVVLRLDCDGNFVAPIEFQIDPSGHRRVTSEIDRVRDPRWYIASTSATNSNGTQNNDVRNMDQRFEIAINRSDLPGPVHRISVETDSPGRPRIWRAMPESGSWLSLMRNGLD